MIEFDVKLVRCDASPSTGIIIDNKNLWRRRMIEKFDVNPVRCEHIVETSATMTLASNSRKYSEAVSSRCPQTKKRQTRQRLAVVGKVRVSTARPQSRLTTSAARNYARQKCWTPPDKKTGVQSQRKRAQFGVRPLNGRLFVVAGGFGEG